MSMTILQEATRKGAKSHSQNLTFAQRVTSGAGFVIPCRDCIGNAAAIAADMPTIAHDGANAFLFRALNRPKALLSCAAFGTRQSIFKELVGGRFLAGRKIEGAFAV